MVFRPKVAVRDRPRAEGMAVAAQRYGEFVDVLSFSRDRGWVQLRLPDGSEKAWVMIRHPTHGQLLELVESFEESP